MGKDGVFLLRSASVPTRWKSDDDRHSENSVRTQSNYSSQPSVITLVVIALPSQMLGLYYHGMRIAKEDIHSVKAYKIQFHDGKALLPLERALAVTIMDVIILALFASTP